VAPSLPHPAQCADTGCLVTCGVARRCLAWPAEEDVAAACSSARLRVLLPAGLFRVAPLCHLKKDLIRNSNE